MERNFYEILNLEERLLPYFLDDSQGNEDTENISEYLDGKVRTAYETQRKKLELEYQTKLKKLKKDKEFIIGAKRLLIGKKYISKKIRNANINGIRQVEEEFRIKFRELDVEYELKFQELDFAFENVKSEELRQKYNANIQGREESCAEYIDEIGREIQEEIKKEEIKEIYSKTNQYNPELIKTVGEGNFKDEGLVLRKPSKNPVSIPLNDERNMIIKQTGTVLFANFIGCESYVNEYQIVRYVDNQQKVDTVYTILDLPKLGFNKKTGKPSSPQYYNCVANKLLSEDAIEGSKHNGGYIGLVERDDNGYDITIDKELSEEEQENLTAIMILRHREEKRKNNNKQKKGEDR